MTHYTVAIIVPPSERSRVREYIDEQIAFNAGLVQTCTDIIRFSHGASSGRKVYRSSFIPGLHDVCMIFEKPRR